LAALPTHRNCTVADAVALAALVESIVPKLKVCAPVRKWQTLRESTTAVTPSDPVSAWAGGAAESSTASKVATTQLPPPPGRRGFLNKA
jgi:hypothetical protein